MKDERLKRQNVQASRVLYPVHQNQRNLTMHQCARSILMVFAISLMSLCLQQVTAQAPMQADGSILLPAQTEGIAPVDPAYQQRLTAGHRWQSFVAQYGPWSVQWNEVTRTPHRAFGKPVPIAGFGAITPENVEAAARAFIRRHAFLLGVDEADLRLTRATRVGQKWYVSFVQMKEGLEVLLSEVELRISADGRVFAFGVDAYPYIDLDLTPALTYAVVKDIAVQGLAFDPARDRITEDNRLYILPRRQDRSLEYHLVYRVDIEMTQPEGNYLTFVDAHDGEIVWRHNRVRYQDVVVRDSGDVQLVTPFDPFDPRPFANMWITIGGTQFVTDSSGQVVANISSPTTLSAQLRGPFIDVNRDDGPDASISMVVNPGDTVDLHWDAGNAHPAERDAYYHANIVHDWITTIDPNFTLINYSMPCRVNINNNCNAFWDGNGINFFLEGGGCPNTGQMPSVVYHEYGHGINDRFYQQQGIPFGMINGAVHEGMADVTSAYIEDDPRIGRGFFGPGTHLRNVDNTARYPDDVSGDPHITGLIIAGAFWDLRQAVGLSTAWHLHHFARYGTPDDANDGIAFSEWFVETLIADDDDGDLTNGTPHMNEIVNAFNAHGIGTGLFMNFSFVHTPVSDTQDTTGTYAVDFELRGVGLPGSDPDSAAVHYSLDGFQTVHRVAASQVGQGQYHAEIPPQSAGTIVEYFITAYDPLAQQSLRFPSADGSYSFLVGFTQILLDELEVPSGWTVGAPDDNATTGIWNRMDPQGVTIGGAFSQPEDDHTPNGVRCFVTDGRNDPNNPGAYDVDGGKTTLFSPVYDLSNLQNPVIRYYKWYSNDLGASPGLDHWQVDISNDSGSVWQRVEFTTESTGSQWVKFQFRVSDYVVPTDMVQMRFVASDFGAGSLIEAGVDDFEILAEGGVVGIDDAAAPDALPTAFELAQNHPNPFNPTTEIRYALPTASRVTLKIYNLLGQEIRTLVEGHKPAGRYAVTWDGRDNAGAPVASGIYIYRMEATGGGKHYRQSRKLVVLK
ncbi:MAG: T9SS C-terminal target domain-containing protein [Calditrichaeota bacterium]|nr:MAG: T9SS C-terminal target domain-containing protein [Calditrichota bacterium]